MSIDSTTNDLAILPDWMQVTGRFQSTLMQWRLLPSLKWTSIAGSWNHWWILSNPLSGEHFRCGEQDSVVLRALSQPRNLLELESHLTTQVGAKKLERSQILSTLQSAIKANLLIEVTAKKTPTEDRSKTSSHRPNSATIGNLISGLQAALSSILFQRVSIANPSIIVKILAKRSSWLFSYSAVKGWLAFIAVSALVFIIGSAQLEPNYWNGLIDLAQMQSLSLWLQLVGIFCFTRLAHELAHAIVCTRMGGHCTDFGLMRVLCIAFPFVDVSDAWRMPDRNKRIAISAAGVYVEAIIAALFVWVWLLSSNENVDRFALQVIAITTGASLLFNANPLMKYDGYFVLSDLLEIPDLQADAKRSFGDWFQSLFFWSRPTNSVLEHYPRGIVWSLRCYNVLATGYRIMLTLGIFTGLVVTLHAWGLAEIGWAIVGCLFFLSIGKHVHHTTSNLIYAKFGRSLNQGSNKSSKVSQVLRFSGIACLWGLIALVLAYAATVPLPDRFTVSGRVVSQNRKPLFISVPRARLVDVSVKNGEVDDIRRGESTLEFDQQHIQARLLEIQQALTEVATRQAAIGQIGFYQPSLFDQLPQLETLFNIRSRQLELTQLEGQRYSLRLNESQRIFQPAPLPPLELLELPNELQQAIHADILGLRDILSPTSIGSRFALGTPVGYSIPHQRRTIVESFVDQKQRADLKVGQAANIRLIQDPYVIRSARVSSISQLINESNDATKSSSADRRNTISSGAAHASGDGFRIELEFEPNGSSQDYVEDGLAEIVIRSNGKSVAVRMVESLQSLTYR